MHRRQGAVIIVRTLALAKRDIVKKQKRPTDTDKRGLLHTGMTLVEYLRRRQQYLDGVADKRRRERRRLQAQYCYYYHHHHHYYHHHYYSYFNIHIGKYTRVPPHL